LIDLLDQPPAYVTFGRGDRVVLEHVVEIDVPAVKQERHCRLPRTLLHLLTAVLALYHRRPVAESQVHLQIRPIDRDAFDLTDELGHLRNVAKANDQLNAAIQAEVKREEIRKFCVKQEE
jgi:hypothetical protein